jgi:hypothetical protein
MVFVFGVLVSSEESHTGEDNIFIGTLTFMKGDVYCKLQLLHGAINRINARIVAVVQ